MFLDIGVQMVRVLINDMEDIPTYTDKRLQMALLIGAQFVNNEFTMKYNYIIDTNKITISPDPVPGNDTANSDGWMLNLSALKTSIFMLRNDLKLAALSAWSIKDTDVNIDLRNMAIYKKELLTDLEKMWEQDRANYAVGVNPAVAAVLTPINIWSYMGHQQNYGIYGMFGPRDHLW